MTIVVAIVINVSSTILVAVNIVALPIVATRDLALGAIGAALVGGVAHRSNSSRLRSALGAAEPKRQRARDLAADLAG